MYSLASRLSGIYLLPAMNSFLVTFYVIEYSMGKFYKGGSCKLQVP